jgi:DNA helicase-2/ATP-dependent DNA helicase PcrA
LPRRRELLLIYTWGRGFESLRQLRALPERYAARTRFIPMALLPIFETVTWPLATPVTAAAVASKQVRIDVGARMRSMWQWL